MDRAKKQYEARSIQILGFGAAYNKGLTVSLVVRNFKVVLDNMH